MFLKKPDYALLGGCVWKDYFVGKAFLTNARSRDFG